MSVTVSQALSFRETAASLVLSLLSCCVLSSKLTSSGLRRKHLASSVVSLPCPFWVVGFETWTLEPRIRYVVCVPCHLVLLRLTWDEPESKANLGYTVRPSLKSPKTKQHPQDNRCGRARL